MYTHRYFQTATVEERDGYGRNLSKLSEYDAAGLENFLNMMSDDGWELIDMEPNWHYSEIVIHSDLGFTKPIGIVGWYLTFKK